MAVTNTTTDNASGTVSETSPWQPKTASTYDKNDTITLVVGPEEHEMLAFESYLSDSDFFQAALKKEWTEGQTRTIKLPEEKPEVVAQYLDFVFAKGLPTRSTKDDCRNGTVYEVLGELYGLGERLLDSRSSMSLSNSPRWEAIPTATHRRTPLIRSTNAPPTDPRFDACWCFGSSPTARRIGSRTVCIMISSATSRWRPLPSFMNAVWNSAFNMHKLRTTMFEFR